MLYINANELNSLTGISYRASLKIIEEVRKEMEKKGYLIPKTRTKLALWWMVKEKIGLKE